jgi:hypothetical protein
VVNKTTGIAYYGLRFAKNTNPADFWGKDRYRTSSKIIHELIKTYGDQDFFFEVRKIFKEKESAIAWERKVNRRLTVKSHKFCNMDSGQRPDLAIQNLVETRKISNPLTSKCLAVPKDMVLPLGWVEGNINQRGLITSKNRRWFHNTETGETSFSEARPEGNWDNGRGPNYRGNSQSLVGKYINITDGNETRLVLSGTTIQEGWRRGKTPSSKEKNAVKIRVEKERGWRWINNGCTNSRLFRNEILPNGWQLGRIMSEKQVQRMQGYNEIRKGQIWIHNPVLQKNMQIDKNEDIPEGFIKGFRKFKK